MESNISFYPKMCEYEVIYTDGKKRMIKRIFLEIGNKKPRIDYCIQYKVKGYDDRWRIDYYNKSKSLVERRYLGL